MRAAFFALVHRVFDEGEVLNVGDIEVTIRPGRPETQSISSPSSRSSQPQGYWEMAEVSLAESSTSSATAKDDNRAHQSEIDPAQKGGGYSASSHPRPDAKRTDYRRRPASRA